MKQYNLTNYWFIIFYDLFRYEKYWIPFIQENSQNYATDKKFCPPLDVLSVWHVHMLAPKLYADDLCKSSLGLMMDHEMCSHEHREQKMKVTEKVWSEQFPDEPFNSSETSKAYETYTCGSSYDLLSACKRQKLFYYQVSLTHYQDKSFLSRSITRYTMFLQLQKKNSNQFLVPCYDIDIVWHTHHLNHLP